MMKKKLVHLSEVLYSAHYHVIKALRSLMPVFVPTSVAQKDLQHHFTDDVRETNGKHGTSTAWWWVYPLGAARDPREVQVCAQQNITPQRFKYYQVSLKSKVQKILRKNH